MDRDRARALLLGALLEDRAVAARVRSELDSSQFGEHSALVMLVADHDLHHPDAPASGRARREAVERHVRRLLDASRRHGRRAGARSAADQRWALAVEAHVSLSAIGAAEQPTGSRPSLTELLEAFAERRGAGRPPEVPGQAGVG
ncbi:MAG TPA: hypothetical protein PKB06_13145, partial [Actinotalea sp.]|nr:hypothetical protein [Actinotalea sp.]